LGGGLSGNLQCPKADVWPLGIDGFGDVLLGGERPR
jgi:hypothetical protein